MYLLHREWRGRARLALRRLTSWKGLAVALAFAAFLLLFAASVEELPARLGATGSVGASALPGAAPYALLLFALIAAFSGRGLYFRPAEVELLFPAPLPRRQLLLYNVLTHASFTALSALWLWVLLVLRGGDWISGGIGALLALWFVQVFAQFGAVLGTALRTRLGARLRNLAIAGALGTPLLAAGLEAQANAGRGVPELLRAVAANPVVAVPTWLTRPFVEVFLADDSLALGGWTALAIAILVALVVGMCALDVPYQEAALERSRRARQRRARLRQGRMFATAAGNARRTLPRFPRLRGAGPIARRQCLDLLRNPRQAVLAVAVVALLAATPPLLLVLGGAPAERADASAAAARTAIGLLLVMSLVMTQYFSFDFRRDLDRMPLLKSLPISPLALAAGQLLPAAVFPALVQLIGIAALVLWSGALSPGACGVLLLLLLPLNWLATAIDNLIFLLLPYRLVLEDPGDMAFVGRMTLVTFGKLLALGLLVLGGLLVGGLVYRATDESPIAGVLAITAAFACACVPLTLLVSWAFRRFDVSADVPG